MCYNVKVKCKAETSIDVMMKICLNIRVGGALERKENIFHLIPSQAAIGERFVSGEICYLLLTHSLLNQHLKHIQPGTSFFFFFFAEIFSRGKINDISRFNISVG